VLHQRDRLLGQCAREDREPAPSYTSVGFSADSKTNVVGANISVNGLRIDIDIDGSGLVPDCGMRLTASSMLLSGDYAMQPMPGDPSNIDVNLASAVGVSFAGFNRTFTYGICDDPIIGDIIQAFMPDVEQLAIDGIKSFLVDPDGAGPADNPIADAIETTTLAGISIAGPVGQGVGLMFDSPLFNVAEDTNGITFGSDARFRVSVGTGPGQCVPPGRRAQPDRLVRSVGGVSELRADDAGPAHALRARHRDLTGRVQPAAPRADGVRPHADIHFDDRPRRAGRRAAAGRSPRRSSRSSRPSSDSCRRIHPPRRHRADDRADRHRQRRAGGELTELRIAHVAIDIVQPSTGTIWLGGAFDARLGMDLDFLPDGSGLAISLAQPTNADLLLSIVYNPLGTNEAQLEAVLPGIIRPLIPELAGALAGFPVPQFFGLSLHGVEVSRNGQFLSLFANLAP
jgi:hypothetical protein